MVGASQLDVKDVQNPLKEHRSVSQSRWWMMKKLKRFIRSSRVSVKVEVAFKRKIGVKKRPSFSSGPLSSTQRKDILDTTSFQWVIGRILPSLFPEEMTISVIINGQQSIDLSLRRSPGPIKRTPFWRPLCWRKETSNGKRSPWKLTRSLGLKNVRENNAEKDGSTFWIQKSRKIPGLLQRTCFFCVSNSKLGTSGL